MGRRSRRDPHGHRGRGKGQPTTDRVVLRRVDGTDRFGSRDPSAPADSGNLEAWMRSWYRGRSRPKTHPVVRLTEDGIDWGAVPQPGDEVGYGMDPYRTDDCLQAAIATVTQVPIEQVPDLALDRRRARGDDPDEISAASWTRIDQWATKRGLRLEFFAHVPVDRLRWIGVVTSSNTGASMVVDPGAGGLVRDDESGGFNDHCLLMAHDRLVFDPSCSVKAPPGMTMMRCDPARISYGISFDKEE